MTEVTNSAGGADLMRRFEIHRKNGLLVPTKLRVVTYREA